MCELQVSVITQYAYRSATPDTAVLLCAAGNGTIEFHEFLTVMSRVLEDENTEDDMITVFRILDQDGDGFITKSDLRECCIRSVRPEGVLHQVSRPVRPEGVLYQVSQLVRPEGVLHQVSQT